MVWNKWYLCGITIDLRVKKGMAILIKEWDEVSQIIEWEV